MSAQPTRSDRRAEDLVDAIIAIAHEHATGPENDGRQGAVIRAALLVAAPSTVARTRLLRQLQGDPSLLTSGSSSATRAVCVLAAALAASGMPGIRRPRCAACDDAVVLAKRTPQGGICAACYNRSRMAPCVRCGRHRRIAGRQPDGGALCSSCRARDPRNHRPCSACGRHAPANARTPTGGVLCGSCSPKPLARCENCGHERPVASRKRGRVLCAGCYRAPQRKCGGCGQRKRVALRARDGQPDLCPACHWAPTRPCTRCERDAPGFGARSDGHVCLHCSAGDLLDQLLAGSDGAPHPELAGVHPIFLANEQPRSLHVWLTRSPARHVLRQLVLGELPLTHQALDTLPQTPSLRHLHALLIAANALAARDPRLAGLQHHTDRTIARVQDPADRRVLRSFTTWQLLRRARAQARQRPTTTLTGTSQRQLVVDIAGFLATLHHDQRSLNDATQSDVDRWIAAGGLRRGELSQFLTWAHQHRHAPQLNVPKVPRATRILPADPETRWALARQLLHENTADPADRVAGILVLLYGQPVAKIARLSTNHLHTRHDDTVTLRLGRSDLQLPPPLDELLLQLPYRRQHGPSAHAPATTRWLFPGRQAAGHQHPEYLARRLRTLGIDPRAGRAAALLDLATQVPAAVLADLLGLTPHTAIRWTQHAAGHWTTYAAHRTKTPTRR